MATLTRQQIFDLKMQLKRDKRRTTITKRYDRQKQAYEYNYQRNLASQIRDRYLDQ